MPVQGQSRAVLMRESMLLFNSATILPSLRVENRQSPPFHTQEGIPLGVSNYSALILADQTLPAVPDSAQYSPTRRNYGPYVVRLVGDVLNRIGNNLKPIAWLGGLAVASWFLAPFLLILVLAVVDAGWHTHLLRDDNTQFTEQPVTPAPAEDVAPVQPDYASVPTTLGPPMSILAADNTTLRKSSPGKPQAKPPVLQNWSPTRDSASALY